MSEEDDTYSTIFTALKHPIRRNILRRLSTSSATYTELLNELDIENGLLTYHLESMRDLVKKKEDGSYALSEFGKAGLGLIRRVEEPPATKNDKHSVSLIGVAAVILLISMVAGIGYLYTENTSLSGDNTHHNEVIRHYQLWTGSISIADKRFTLTSDNRTPNVTIYREVTSKLDLALALNQIPGLRESFVGCNPDWVNGTAYIVLNSTSPELKERVMSLFRPDTSALIRFVDAPASRAEIDVWSGDLLGCWDELKARGVKVTSQTLYYDGRILVDVEALDPGKIKVFAEVIQNKVPPGVVVLKNSGPIVLTDASALRDFGVYLTSTKMKIVSTSDIRFYNSSSNEFALTSNCTQRLRTMGSSLYGNFSIVVLDNVELSGVIVSPDTSRSYPSGQIVMIYPYVDSGETFPSMMKIQMGYPKDYSSVFDMRVPSQNPNMNKYFEILGKLVT